MGTVVPPVSPWTFYDVTDANGKHISATVTFNGTWTNATALTGGSVFRDPDCHYTQVIIGSINLDGSLPAGTKVIAVPAGTTNFTAGQLAAVGLSTIGDIETAPQITAIP